MDQGVLKKKIEQLVGLVKPSQSNNLGLSQAQLKARLATSLTTHTKWNKEC